MQKRFLPALFAAVLSLFFFGFGCTKLDTTTLGGDLVTIDNINTKADTLSVIATQGFFNDSTIVRKTDNYVIGNLTTDPLFGTTTAAVYVQFKPNFYPFFFGNAGDTTKNDPLGKANLDSAFVCLSYRGVWGDSSATAFVTAPITQTFELRRISDVDFRNKNDTVRKLDYRPNVDPTLLGSALITPQQAQKLVYLGKGANLDSVNNQIRIPLNTAAGIALARNIYYNQDSTATGPNNALYNDGLFRSYLNGFAITVNGPGNTLYYVSLADQKSRFEFHYHKTKNGIRDTVVQSFQMYPITIGTDSTSSSANYVKRNYAGAQISNPVPTNLYLQTSPGTYASLNIPGLTGYSNRIVHRAYLIVEQTPYDVTTDPIYSAPPYLYLDLKDTSTAVPQRYKPVYFDLNTTYAYNPDATDLSSFYHPYPAANVDVLNFGGNSLNRSDGTGNFTRYEINITRYVQHIVTNGYHNYDLRLYAPYSYYYNQYPGNQYIIPFYNPLAEGRVRVGAGNNLNHPMRLVVIYSKIP